MNNERFARIAKLILPFDAWFNVVPNAGSDNDDTVAQRIAEARALLRAPNAPMPGVKDGE